MDMTAYLEIRQRAGINRESWDELAATSEEAWLWHLADYVDAMLTWPRFRDASFGVLDETGNLLATVPLYFCVRRLYGVISHRYLYSQGGPAFAPHLSPECRRHVLETLRSQWVPLMSGFGAERIEVRMSPLAPRLRHNAAASADLLATAGFEDAQAQTWLVDLSRAPEAIRSGYATSTRYRLRKTARASYMLREAKGSRDVDAYFALHRETYARSGAEIHPIDYFRIIFERFVPKGLARIVFFERDGHVIAAQNTAIYKGSAYSWTGASSSEKDGGENRVLFDDQIIHAKACGCAVYETGEAFVNTTDAKERGLSDFKRSFGAELAIYPSGRLLSSTLRFRAMRAGREFLRAVRI
jgi:hypothetical protein